MPNFFLSLYFKSLRQRFCIRKRKVREIRMTLNFQTNQTLPNISLPISFYTNFFSCGMEDDWLQMINISNEFGVWTLDDLKKRILDYLIPNGGILLTHNGNIIACASACFIEMYKPYAVLSYVIVLKQYQRKGLGKFATIKAAEIAKRAGYPGMILKTHSYRTGAVKLYKDLGFVIDNATYNKSNGI